jgi:hypothetical protein
VGWISDRQVFWWHIPKDHRICSDDRSVADEHRPKDGSPHPDGHSAAYCRRAVVTDVGVSNAYIGTNKHGTQQLCIVVDNHAEAIVEQNNAIRQ